LAAWVHCRRHQWLDSQLIRVGFAQNSGSTQKLDVEFYLMDATERQVKHMRRDGLGIEFSVSLSPSLPALPPCLVGAKFLRHRGWE
jgi:hypothetical protein